MHFIINKIFKKIFYSGFLFHLLFIHFHTPIHATLIEKNYGWMGFKVWIASFWSAPLYQLCQSLERLYRFDPTFKSKNVRRINHDGRAGPRRPVWPDWAIYWLLDKFLKPLAAMNLSKSLAFLGNFCKDVKICQFSSEIIFRQLF